MHAAAAATAANLGQIMDYQIETAIDHGEFHLEFSTGFIRALLEDGSDAAASTFCTRLGLAHRDRLSGIPARNPLTASRVICYRIVLRRFVKTFLNFGRSARLLP